MLLASHLHPSHSTSAGRHEREGRLASRALEMRPFGEAKCLEDGPDAAERRPRSGFPRAGGQETAISRHITTYRQHRRDPGR
nr:unnamed protein product [Digitaria exilis]